MSKYLANTEVFIDLARGFKSPTSKPIMEWLRQRGDEHVDLIDVSCASYVRVILESEKKGKSDRWRQRLRDAERNLLGPTEWNIPINEQLGEIYSHLEKENLNTEEGVPIDDLELAVCATAIYDHYTLLVFRKTPWLEELESRFGLTCLEIAK